MDKLKIAIIALIILGSIGAVQQYLVTITDQPAIMYILSSTLGVLIFGLLRNIEGFLENKLGTDPNTPYEAKQLGQTLGRFTVYIFPIVATIQTAFQGTPYANAAIYIAGTIAIVLDFVIKKLDSLGNAVSNTTPVVVSTGK